MDEKFNHFKLSLPKKDPAVRRVFFNSFSFLSLAASPARFQLRSILSLSA
jgi:hypothetical protein